MNLTATKIVANERGKIYERENAGVEPLNFVSLG